jgi:hypothetical protein
MFRRELQLGNRKVVIMLRSKVYVEHDDCHFFGFPLYPRAGQARAGIDHRNYT